jgi:hypothetical protein
MCAQRKVINETIDKLLLDIYPNLQHKMVHICSNTDAYTAQANDALDEFKSEFYSIFMYDVRLVFPAVLSAMEGSKNFENFDIYSMLDLLGRKEEKLLSIYLEYKRRIHELGLSQREMDFFKAIEQDYMTSRNQLNASIKRWITEKVRS